MGVQFAKRPYREKLSILGEGGDISAIVSQMGSHSLGISLRTAG